MKTILKVLGWTVALVVLLAIIIPTVAWSGGAIATIEIRVLDDSTNRPVSGAEVYFLQDSEREGLTFLSAADAKAWLVHLQGYGVTDAAGQCSVKKSSGAGGGNFLFWRTGKLIIEGPLLIRANGYEDLEGLIQNFIGGKRFPLRQNTKSITIFLKKNRPNKAVEPTTMRVTDPADAGSAPRMVAAHF